MKEVFNNKPDIEIFKIIIKNKNEEKELPTEDWIIWQYKKKDKLFLWMGKK